MAFFFICTKQSCVLEVDVCWTHALQKLFTHKSTAGCIDQFWISGGIQITEAR